MMASTSQFTDVQGYIHNVSAVRIPANPRSSRYFDFELQEAEQETRVVCFHAERRYEVKVPWPTPATTKFFLSTTKFFLSTTKFFESWQNFLSRRDKTPLSRDKTLLSRRDKTLLSRDKTLLSRRDKTLLSRRDKTFLLS